MVDRAWDEAGNVGCRAKYLREGVGKRRRSLDRRKVYLADIVAAQKGGNAGLEDVSQQRERGRRETYESPKPNVALAWLSVI